VFEPLDCGGVVVPDDPPQPLSERAIAKSKMQHAARDLPDSASRNRGKGATMARNKPEGARMSWLLLVALTVIVVVSGVVPDNVDGAKLQLKPVGNPVQANETEAANPFSGVTETVKDPGADCEMLSVPLESVKP
jgi:hypothetical protein